MKYDVGVNASIAMQNTLLEGDQSSAGSRTELAYQVLRSEILRGALLPGQRLRAADLEARFSLGLTPIREALMRLGTEGLVIAESNRGARVKGVSQAEFADLMKTRREVERICLRDSVTAGDARWEAELIAAMHMLSRAQLPDASAAQERDDSSADGTGQWEACHRRFHTALVSACGSPWMLRFWNQLVDHSERYRKLRFSTPLVPRNVEAEHQELLETALRRDVAACVDLMDRHLQGTEKAVQHMLAEWTGRLRLD